MRDNIEIKSDGGPAFPRAAHWSDGGSARFDHGAQDGMTLRDWFAGQALAGMLAYSHVNPQRGNYHENCSVEGAAEDAYRYADAMLAEREKRGAS
jgi:hypothetical protein